MTTRRQLQNRPQGKHRPRRVTPIVGGPPRVMTVKQFMLGLISKDEAKGMLDRALHAANKPSFFMDSLRK